MPNQVIWITASAGTGKTTALINRYKTLLQTCRPEQIIGITFTINAAEEIKERLTNDKCVIQEDREAVCLGPHVASHPEKKQPVFSINFFNSPQRHTISDRPLASQDDTLNALRIQTIHSLCHQLLSTYTQKNIRILDPNEKELLIDQALRMALNEPTELTKRLAQRFSFYHLQSLMEKIASHLADRQHVIGDKPRDFDFTDVTAVFEPIVPNPEITETFRRATPNNVTKGSRWSMAHLSDSSRSEDSFENDIGIFLTKTGEVRKRILDASTAKKYPDLVLIMQDEAYRLYALMQERASQEWLHDNNLMHQLADRVWNHYQMLKKGRLDYDELINATQKLLEDDVARYDICKSIHHVLLDEAQDTNPKQWRIIELLTQHLFDDPATSKSFFVVGDHKQAIYGFQNASPEFMEQQKQKYKSAAREGFVEQALEVNYRSVSKVCDYVETQCLSPPVKAAREHTGFVLDVVDFDEALAKFLSDPPLLPSQNRLLELRDIMILCRKRDKIYHGIIEKYGDQIRFEQTQLLSDMPDIQTLMYRALLLAEPDNAYAAYKLSSIGGGAVFPGVTDSSPQDVESVRTGIQEMKQQALDPGSQETLGQRSCQVFRRIREDSSECVLSLIASTLSHNPPLLDTVLDFVAQHNITTTKSLYWRLRAYPHSLKTVSRDNPNTMRLLTMHGAKGLQAPVVFVFNDWSAYHQQDIWWNHQVTDFGDFVIPPTKAVHHPTLTAIREQNKAQQIAEDARLRYVAFTRAMDVLVVVRHPDADTRDLSAYGRGRCVG